MEVRCEATIFVKAGGEAAHTTLHLTRLDQIRNNYYPIILFYKGCRSYDTDHRREGSHMEEDEKRRDPVAVVRHGLEAIIEHYPWVAGRFRVITQTHTSQYGQEEEQESLEVCIDKDGGPGVQFVAASVNRPLDSLGDLSHPNPAFGPLFANVDERAPSHSRPLVALQVSTFECGGFCVSMTSNHALFDGCSASMFLRSMGSSACDKGLCLPLDLTPRELRIFPSNPPSFALCCSLYAMHKKDFKQYLTTKEASYRAPLVATKFVFTNHDISKLRLHALSKQDDCKRGFQACSRFQVLTSHLWRAKARCMLALYGDPSEQFPLYIGVNMRERGIGSIPKNYVGNALGAATPSLSLKELHEKSLAFVVEVIQDAIEHVSPKCFQSYVDYLELLGANACMACPSMMVPYLANLGFYDIDFGFGKPTTFGRHFKQARNRVIIMDGDPQCMSFNVMAAFTSKEELNVFQDALKSELSC